MDWTAYSELGPPLERVLCGDGYPTAVATQNSKHRALGLTLPEAVCPNRTALGCTGCHGKAPDRAACTAEGCCPVCRLDIQTSRLAPFEASLLDLETLPSPWVLTWSSLYTSVS